MKKIEQTKEEPSIKFKYILDFVDEVEKQVKDAGWSAEDVIDVFRIRFKLNEKNIDTE